MPPPTDATLRQLRYFAALAEDRHFGKAATRLGISQPTLTRQIQNLEKIVGAALLKRTSRTVSLTAAGEAFAERALLTLRNHDQSIETARNVSTRRNESLAVGFECCAPYHDFAEVVKRFTALYPRTRVSSFMMSSAEQPEALARRRIDVGFLHPPVPEDPMFTFEKVDEERFVVALPSSHKLAARKLVPCSQLAGEKFALYPRALAPGCYDAVHRICAAAGFTPEVVHESNDIFRFAASDPRVGCGDSRSRVRREKTCSWSCFPRNRGKRYDGDVRVSSTIGRFTYCGSTLLENVARR